jgi:hypothetical protein
MSTPKEPVIDILGIGLNLGKAAGQGPFGSNLCRFEDMATDEYRIICTELLHERPRPHRKQWEFAYIIWHLSRLGLISDNKRGIGFGVGSEPLPAIFASKECIILATDAPAESNDQGWALTGQHASSLSSLYRPNILANADLDLRCTFRPLDMNDYASIPEGWDFHWSSCVIEHLGGIDKAIDFIVESCTKLAPKGVAVHTTEFNLSSNEETIDQPGTCILRKKDLEVLQHKLSKRGLHLQPLILDPGSHTFNYYVDAPPYEGYNHLRLDLWGYAATSVGLIIRKD